MPQICDNVHALTVDELILTLLKVVTLHQLDLV